MSGTAYHYTRCAECTVEYFNADDAADYMNADETLCNECQFVKDDEEMAAAGLEDYLAGMNEDYYLDSFMESRMMGEC